MPQYLEQICVVEQFTVAGTFDRLVMHKDKLRVADYKTGSIYGLGTIAIQLALYANAGTLYDPLTKTHTPMPNVDKTTGLILHLPAGEGTCTIYEVDLEAGWKAAQLCADVRRFRGLKGLAWPASSQIAVAEKTPSRDDIAEVAPPKAKRSRKKTAGPVDPFDGLPKSPPAEQSEVVQQIQALNEATERVTEASRAVEAAQKKTTDKLRLWLKTRGTAIAHAGYANEMIAEWPEGVATLGKSDNHSEAELDAIANFFSRIEARHVMPFGDPDPRKVTEARVSAAGVAEVLHVAPSAPEIDEGPPLTSEELNAYQAKLAALTPAQQATLGRIAKEANDAGLPINLKACPSQRRGAIIDALIHLKELDEAEMRLAVIIAVGAEPEHDKTLGALVGRLSLEQAETLADIGVVAA